MPMSISQAAKPSDHKHKPVLLAKNGHSATPEVTSVPNPMPDTGFRPLLTTASTFTAFPTKSVHSVPLSKTGLPLPFSSALLPTTPSDNNISQTPTSTPTFIPLATSYVGGDPFAGNTTDTYPPQATTASRKLSIPLIVLLAVGCAIMVIGIFSLVKYYSRPSRRPRPRPSLPVLDDPFSDDKGLSLEDSPVFGGKERMSNSIWSWSHYPQPAIVVTKPPSIVQPAEEANSLPGRASHCFQGYSAGRTRTSSAYSGYGHGHSQSVPTITSGSSPFQASMQQLQGALSRTATRTSVTSNSSYSSSPQNHHGVGLAITRSPTTTFTADGSNVLKRSEPKAALEKSRNDLVAEAARGPGSASLRNSEGSSYSGTEMGSPSFLPYAPLRLAPTSYAGRSKIKSSYYNPNSYPRISNAALAVVDKARTVEIGRQPSLRKSETRRDRDTQALTQALGLSSPASEYALPSPQPTLYPDDSLSVVDTKRVRTPPAPNLKKQSSGRGQEDDDRPSRPSLPVIATAMDASAALGSLMLMDYNGHATRADDPSTKRMSKTNLSRTAVGETGPGPGGDSTSLHAKPLKRSPSRSNDKPPSIPLPELLPSLEQMSLEHSNPQAYADYRSPTYSIYGLYGSERKSTVGY